MFTETMGRLSTAIQELQQHTTHGNRSFDVCYTCATAKIAREAFEAHVKELERLQGENTRTIRKGIDEMHEWDGKFIIDLNDGVDLRVYTDWPYAPEDPYWLKVTLMRTAENRLNEPITMHLENVEDEQLAFQLAAAMMGERDAVRKAVLEQDQFTLGKIYGSIMARYNVASR